MVGKSKNFSVATKSVQFCVLLLVIYLGRPNSNVLASKESEM